MKEESFNRYIKRAKKTNSGIGFIYKGNLYEIEFEGEKQIVCRDPEGEIIGSVDCFENMGNIVLDGKAIKDNLSEIHNMYAIL